MGSSGSLAKHRWVRVYKQERGCLQGICPGRLASCMGKPSHSYMDGASSFPRTHILLLPEILCSLNCIQVAGVSDWTVREGSSDTTPAPTPTPTPTPLLSMKECQQATALRDALWQTAPSGLRMIVDARVSRAGKEKHGLL